jgi:hypothetical protein
MADDTSPAEEARIAAALKALTDADARLDPPPAGLWSRIEAEVSEAEVGAAEVGDARRPARPARWRPGPLLSVAAVVLVALLGAAIVAALVDGDDDVTAQVRLSPADLPAGRPDATGSARVLEEGGERRLAVEVSGLPRPDGFYEVWLLGPGLDTFQAVGTTDGSGEFLVPRNLDLDQYPIVDVSIEPLDGDPAHSGRSVLRGRFE